MTEIEKSEIKRLHESGLGYKRISSETGISVNTVKSFLKTSVPLGAEKNRGLNCGVPVVQAPHRKQKSSALTNVVMPGGQHIRKTARKSRIEMFNAVQAEAAERARKFSKVENKNTTELTGRVFCGNCGKRCRRKIRHGTPIWICNTYNSQGKEACAAKAVPESVLLNLDSRYNAKCFILCNDNKVIVKSHDDSEIIEIWADNSRTDSWTAEKKKLQSERMKESWRKDIKKIGGQVQRDLTENMAMVLLRRATRWCLRYEDIIWETLEPLGTWLCNIIK